MLFKIKEFCCFFAVLALSVCLPGTVFATTVGTELILLADVSGSLDNTDFTLQRDGYAAAFRNVDIINAIQSQSGGIAVTFVYWSTGQYQSVGWTHITDATTSNAFADAIARAERPSSGSTYMASAMNYAGGLFNNNYESIKQIVDVSGDGADTTHGDGNSISLEVQSARNNLVNNFGVDMINALWIDDRHFFGDDLGDLVQAVPYGQNNVIYGDGSFSWIVDSFQEFEGAIEDKIYTEIHESVPEPVPEPSTFILFGAGLAGIAYMRRRNKK